MFRILLLFLIASLGTVHAQRMSIADKLSNTTVDSVEFDETSLHLVVELIRQKANGLNIILRPEVDREAPVTFKMENAPLREVLRYALEMSRNTARIDRQAITIVPLPLGAPVRTTSEKTNRSKSLAVKLSSIRLESVNFDETPIRDVYTYLAQRSGELSRDRKPVSIILGVGVDGNQPVSLSLTNVPLSTVINYAAELSRNKVRVDSYAVVIASRIPVAAPTQ